MSFEIIKSFETKITHFTKSYIVIGSHSIYNFCLPNGGIQYVKSYEQAIQFLKSGLLVGDKSYTLCIFENNKAIIWDESNPNSILFEQEIFSTEILQHQEQAKASEKKLFSIATSTEPGIYAISLYTSSTNCAQIIEIDFRFFTWTLLYSIDPLATIKNCTNTALCIALGPANFYGTLAVVVLEYIMLFNNKGCFFKKALNEKVNSLLWDDTSPFLKTLSFNGTLVYWAILSGGNVYGIRKGNNIWIEEKSRISLTDNTACNDISLSLDEPTIACCVMNKKTLVRDKKNEKVKRVHNAKENGFESLVLYNLDEKKFLHQKYNKFYLEDRNLDITIKTCKPVWYNIGLSKTCLLMINDHIIIDFNHEQQIDLEFFEPIQKWPVPNAGLKYIPFTTSRLLDLINKVYSEDNSNHLNISRNDPTFEASNYKFDTIDIKNRPQVLMMNKKMNSVFIATIETNKIEKLSFLPCDTIDAIFLTHSLIAVLNEGGLCVELYDLNLKVLVRKNILPRQAKAIFQDSNILYHVLYLDDQNNLRCQNGSLYYGQYYFIENYSLYLCNRLHNSKSKILTFSNENRNNKLQISKLLSNGFLCMFKDAVLYHNADRKNFTLRPILMPENYSKRYIFINDLCLEFDQLNSNSLKHSDTSQEKDVSPFFFKQDINQIDQSFADEKQEFDINSAFKELFFET